jgi:hypothetical protein
MSDWFVCKLAGICKVKDCYHIKPHEIDDSCGENICNKASGRKMVIVESGGCKPV